MLLLGPADEELLTVEVLPVELVDGLEGALVGGEVDEAEATALALLVTGKGGRRDVAVLGEELAELVLGSLGV